MAKLRITEISRKKGIKQEDIADHVGMLRTSLSNAISKKTLPFYKLEEIAKYLGVDVTDLISSKTTNVCPHCKKPIKITIEK